MDAKTGIGDDDFKGKSYRGNAPKIMLETISARTAFIIVAITYLTFALGFLFDLRSTVLGFRTGITRLPSETCDSQNITIGYTENDYGCTDISFDQNETKQSTWTGHVTDFSNVISVALQAKFTNTSYLINSALDDDFIKSVVLKYNIELYCCYQPHYCGQVGSSDSKWKRVLKEENRKIYLSDFYESGDETLKVNVLPTTFQNQEALPDNGKVESYMIFVTYFDLSPNEDFASNLEYTFGSLTRKSMLTARIMLQFCVVFSLVVIALYVIALRKRYASLSLTLPEQRWILWFMIMVVFFQNPIYCVVVWQSDPAVEAVFATYVMDAFAQSGFFTLWLLFADSLRKHTHSSVYFYLPKLLMGLLMFVVNLTVTVMQFPTLSAASDRSPVEATAMWSDDTKLALILFSISFLGLLWLWTLWWIYNLWYTAKKLKKLPYMNTRYLQLWFRFFLIQASLVALYYVFQYFTAISYILNYQAGTKHTTAQHLADYINTLFRQQSFLFGKVFFLTTYGAILAFFALPAGVLDKSSAETAAILGVTYVVSESELAPVQALRLNAYKHMKTLSRITAFNSHVFCVELAMNLMEVSYQAYYDPVDTPSASGYGTMEVLSLGYKLVHHVYNEETDTVCFIFKHIALSRVVVAFRGTCSKKHWAANLKYSKTAVELENLHLPEVDASDGLNVPDYTKVTRDNSGHLQRMLNYLTSAVDTPTPDELEAQHMSAPKTPTLWELPSKSMRAVAAKTPVLSNSVQTELHSGFWEAYASVRTFLHTTMRQELKMNPAEVFCTGHSLGGALATIAAIDLSLHTLPRVNAFLDHERQQRDALTQSADSESMSDGSHPKKIRLGLYNFGSPRVGNYHFARIFNTWVPNSFRVVVDGDIVSGVPKRTQHFKHVRVQVTIDALGTGSIIIDPSFVEKWLRMQRRTSVSAHALGVYRRALLGVKSATEFMRSHQDALGGMSVSADQFDENIYAAAQFKMAKRSAKAAREKMEEIREDSVSSPMDLHAVCDREVSQQSSSNYVMDSFTHGTNVLCDGDKLDIDTRELVSLVEAADETAEDMYSRASMFVRDISTRFMGGISEVEENERDESAEHNNDEDHPTDSDVELRDRSTNAGDDKFGDKI